MNLSHGYLNRSLVVSILREVGSRYKIKFYDVINKTNLSNDDNYQKKSIFLK